MEPLPITAVAVAESAAPRPGPDLESGNPATIGQSLATPPVLGGLPADQSSPGDVAISISPEDTAPTTRGATSQPSMEAAESPAALLTPSAPQPMAGPGWGDRGGGVQAPDASATAAGGGGGGDSVLQPQGSSASSAAPDDEPMDIVLHVEFASKAEVKALTYFMLLVLVVGAAITAYIKLEASRDGVSWYDVTDDDDSFESNLITGYVCVSIAGCMWLLYVGLGSWFVFCRAAWDRRRARIYLVKLAELATLVVSFSVWTYSSDARRLQEDCQQFATVLTWTWGVRLTMGNTLLCLWNVTARGMTLRRGAMLTAFQRFSLGIQRGARQCWRTVTCRTKKAGGGVLSGGGAVGGQLAGFVSWPKDAPKTTDMFGPMSGASNGANGNGSGVIGVQAAWHSAPLPSPPAAPVPPPAAPPPPESPEGAPAAAVPGDGAPSGSPPVRPDEAEVPSLVDLDPDPANDPHADSSQPPSPPRPVSAFASSKVEALVAAGALPLPQPPPPTHIGPEGRMEDVGPSGAGTAVPGTGIAGIGGGALGGSGLPECGPGAAAGAVPEPADDAGQGSGQGEDGDAAGVAAARSAALYAAAQAARAAATPEQLYMDGPWWAYLGPFLWLWLPFQFLIVANILLLDKNVDELPVMPRSSRIYKTCAVVFLECKLESKTSAFLNYIMTIAEIAYAFVYFYNCFRAFRFLQSRPYVEVRQLHIILSIEMRFRAITLVYIVVNDAIKVFYVPKAFIQGLGSVRCRYSLDTILGIWSTEVIVLVLVCVLAWLFIPRRVAPGMPILQATLQRFSWTEPDKARQLRHRLAAVPQHVQRCAELAREPLFCFETAVKLTYWCEQSYYYEEEGLEMRVPLPVLMNLYDLKEITVIREEESDAKAMVAWSSERCLICFRGTASLKAVCVDLKAVMAPYYNRSAWSHVSRRAPLARVHSGFQWSWLHMDFNRRVLDWVVNYHREHPRAQIMISGHSLGGAHAILCTLDVMAELGASVERDQVSCYTFGVPRVGNHAFAHVYNRAVHETWNVINSNDIIPLTPKVFLWYYYKHPGLKVIVRQRGDLIVRPTFTENAVARLPGSRSVLHHLLGSYVHSLVTVLRKQTRGKHIDGGIRALLHMAKYDLEEVHAVLDQVLEEVHLVAAAAADAVAEMEAEAAADAAKSSLGLPWPSRARFDSHGQADPHPEAAPGADEAGAGDGGGGANGGLAQAGDCGGGVVQVTGRGIVKVASKEGQVATCTATVALAAAKSAALAAGRGGEVVFQALVKHGSIRMLVEEEHLLALRRRRRQHEEMDLAHQMAEQASAEAAAAAAAEQAGGAAEAPSGAKAWLSVWLARADVFRRSTGERASRGFNTFLELLGFETGMDDYDEEDDLLLFRELARRAASQTGPTGHARRANGRSALALQSAVWPGWAPGGMPVRSSWARLGPVFEQQLAAGAGAAGRAAAGAGPRIPYRTVGSAVFPGSAPQRPRLGAPSGTVRSTLRRQVTEGELLAYEASLARQSAARQTFQRYQQEQARRGTAGAGGRASDGGGGGSTGAGGRGSGAAGGSAPPPAARSRSLAPSAAAGAHGPAWLRSRSQAAPSSRQATTSPEARRPNPKASPSQAHGTDVRAVSGQTAGHSAGAEPASEPKPGATVELAGADGEERRLAAGRNGGPGPGLGPGPPHEVVPGAPGGGAVPESVGTDAQVGSGLSTRAEVQVG
ncbi:hypothetical protein HYH03_001749 [Edaphochlamys debaryana]|uniref:Fungal lipase-type domain-containing protein n=1 Tax=Edaphochlamys debaryana TaxID=47281 RepID=A0A835YEG5_9CHLO|nr:hypothetical protein HYH03_001749 [Edaphochlamys debaryana]|eukprot:KAG2500167.1 hypothetical protein HYH03_001749 [Edaphochlamys debaryana]